MEEIVIYKYQLKAIENALRLTVNIYRCDTKETCYDRQVMKAQEFVKEALLKSKTN